MKVVLSQLLSCSVCSIDAYLPDQLLCCDQPLALPMTMVYQVSYTTHNGFEKTVYVCFIRVLYSKLDASYDSRVAVTDTVTAAAASIHGVSNLGSCSTLGPKSHYQRCTDQELMSSSGIL